MPTYMPILFVAPSPESETLGGPLLGLIQNIRADEIRPILKKHGLDAIEADKWYPLQSVLNVFRDIIESRENVNEELVAIAVKTVDTAALPPEINSVEGALGFIGQLVKSTNRYVPDDYGIFVDINSPHYALVTNNTPLPETPIFGYLWGLINRFKAPDQIFSVKALPTEPGSPVVFSVRWGLPDELEEN